MATVTPPEYNAPKVIIFDSRRGEDLPKIRPLWDASNNVMFDEKILDPLAEELDNKNKQKEYTVKKGDSLWKIAKQELGDGSRWIEIARANRLREDGRSVIRPGDKLIIPSKKSANLQTTPRKKETISQTTTKTKSLTTPTLRTTTNRPTTTTNTLNVTVASYYIDPRSGQVVAPSTLSLYIPNSSVRVSPQPLNFVQQPTSRGLNHVQIVYVDPNIPSQPDNWFRNTYLESLLTDSQPLSESIANGSKPLYELYQANPPKPVPKPKRGRNNMDFDWRKYR